MKRACNIALILIVWSIASPPIVRAADFQVGNVSSYVGDRRWNWTVYITGPRSILDRIRCVEYTLHPTFPDPIQVVCNRGSDDSRAFPLSASGWGEFDIGVKVVFQDRSTRTTTYRLRLQAPPTAPCRVMIQRSLTEDDVWTLPDPFRPLHIYLEDLHTGRPADVVVFSTRRHIDNTSFDWGRLKNTLRASNENLRIADETFVTLHAAPNTVFAVGRTDGEPALQFFVSEPAKGTAQISLCEAPRATTRR